MNTLLNIDVIHMNNMLSQAILRRARRERRGRVLQAANEISSLICRTRVDEMRINIGSYANVGIDTPILVTFP